ncbi:uncharacterized protein VDAG_02093 [Verticillium dahliae VdLs.17]|uniref:ABC transporter domain-containing protein n=1 Tax=Verticillium dahliae (strain VdLs.17 / ATCC MYA-4575 / FGSC 10137) TaxID=498257 RepID=G2WUV2_VERDV|nr:uncharacterized protein VDAG_02093 [Verticillium dahliae VdLs.17]EGY20077.1 hypothetical protein VDAG_02093 [Verticillium dahliae VdLs.17]
MGDTDSFKGFESNSTFLKTIGQPQAPLLPRVQAEGPTFVDTQACICSLRTTPGQDGAAGWRCLGNRTEEMYLTNDGKWFNAQNDAATLDGPIHDATNPPDTTKALKWADNKSELVPITGNNDLPVYDQTCSGTNHTTFSTSYYRAAAQLERDEAPVDGAPCFRPGAVPVQIQTIDEWQEHGCAEGFLCEYCCGLDHICGYADPLKGQNNTVNSLPQYCTPLTICQQARLAGKACEFEGRNIGMGVFEPIICQGGYYCPPAQRTTIKCPSGSYCQPGAPSPTPCSTGSYCPKGATSEAVVIPVGIVVIVDLFIGAMLLWVVLRQRRKNGKRMNFPGIPFIAKSASRKGIQAAVTGYKQLDDETDQEMQPMQFTYLPYRPGTGFQAVLDVPVARAPTVKLRRANTLAALNPQLKAFVDSMSRATDVQADNLGLSFAYNGLTFQPKGRPTPILQNVTGRIDKGSLVAVMGGSGAGKSTFVNVLMGKTKNTGGTVTVNNIPGKIEQYKKIIGYVPQDDVVLPELTVRENILHSARIRLPRSWSDKDVSAHVDSYRLKPALFFEIGLSVLSGFLIGLSQDGKKGVLFRGYYRAPYEDLSLSADFASPAQLALLQAIGIGLICGAPGVKIFSEEVILHRREAEAGHSRLAYFLAKTVSVMPRMILSCLHFTTLVHILSRPIISWTLAYCMNLLYFYCIYGLASVVSMVVRREDAPLISTMVSFIVGLLSGASPALSQVKTWHMEWLWRASPGTWFAEVYFGQLAGPFQYLYDTDMAAKFTGYNLATLQVGALVLFAIGTIYRILAFGGLLVCGRMRI